MDLSGNIEALNFSKAMGESNCTLTILDVANILQTNFAYISGGKSRRSFTIVSFPECPSYSSVTDDQFKAIFTYLASVLSPAEQEAGVVVVIDRRHDKWSSVKTLLIQITSFFPTSVQKVYVLRPLGFLQKTFADTGLKFIKEEFRVKVLILDSTEILHDYIDKNQLTSEFDGSLVFNLSEWIQHRAALEKFSGNVAHTKQNMLSICQDLQEREFPNDVTQTEVLIHDHDTIKVEIKEDLESTMNHGRVLLECFVGPKTDENAEDQLELLPKSKQSHVCSVRRLLSQLEEAAKNFDLFWNVHKVKLEQCLQLRKFEEDFKQLQYACDKHLKVLELLPVKCDSPIETINLLTELQKFEESSKNDMTLANLLRFRGEKFIEENHYALDCIRPKCFELDRVIQTYNDTLTSALDKAATAKELFEKIENADKWCTRGVDFLASQAVETNRKSKEVIIKVLKGLDTMIEEFKTLDLNDPKEFHQKFNVLLTPEIKDNVQQVLNRSEDVHGMLTKCKQQLSSQIKENHIQKPIHVVQPERVINISPPLSNNNNNNNNSISHFSMSMMNLALPVAPAVPQAVSSVYMNGLQEPEEQQTKGKRKFSFKRRSSKLERSLSKSTHNLEAIKANGYSFNMDKDDNLQTKRSEIMRKILASERVYVGNLEIVLKHFANQMDSNEMGSLLPEDLAGKQQELFGNWSDICTFHSDVFLKELESAEYMKSIETICFSFTIHRGDLLKLYVKYCGNKMTSDELIKKVSSCDFLKECHKQASTKEALDVLLNKPFQQLHVYHDLLKELLKYCVNDPSFESARDAVETVSKLIQQSTDAMNLVSIEGFSGNLSAGGKLIQQGSFLVQTDGKGRGFLKNKSGSPRHIFFFETFMVICKKKTETNGNEKLNYIFKAVLPTLEIALKENIKGDRKKFQVSVHKTNESYVIQAPTVTMKDLWVSEIKRILLGQFERIKSDNVNRNIFKSLGNLPSIESTLGNLKGNNNNNIQSLNSGCNSNASSSSMIDLSRPLLLGNTYIVAANHSATRPDEISLSMGSEVVLVHPGEEGWSLIKEVDSPKNEGWFPTKLLIGKKPDNNIDNIFSKNNYAWARSTESLEQPA